MHTYMHMHVHMHVHVHMHMHMHMSHVHMCMHMHMHMFHVCAAQVRVVPGLRSWRPRGLSTRLVRAVRRVPRWLRPPMPAERGAAAGTRCRMKSCPHDVMVQCLSIGHLLAPSFYLNHGL